MFGQAFLIALRSIWSKKTRSFLTMLGVIIGVSQIIALIGLGQGVKRDVASEVTALGSNILFVIPGKIQTSSGGYNPAASVGASTLTDADVTAIKAMPEVEDVMVMSLMAALPRAGDHEALGTIVIASESNFLDFLKMYKLTTGRFFSAQESQDAANVIVVGKDAMANLFPGAIADQVVGKTVQLGKENFEVVGVIEQQETNSFFSSAGGSSGGAVIVPFPTAKKLNSNTQIFRIGVKTDENADIKRMKEVLAAKLKDLHGADDTTVFTQEDILKVVDNVLGLITKAIVGLSSISLIVGGIGIMNIMLVAVSERTKEIGLRKALGATRGNILVQFLTESAIISLIGGGLGVGLVTVASIVVKAKAHLSIVVNLNSIMTAVAFSLGVGVLFGLLPAIRAARKDPIEALRYE